MTYVYHYHAFWQAVPGEIAHVDGTVVRGSMITSQDEYSGVKKAIAETFNRPDETKITVASLTLLNPPT